MQQRDFDLIHDPVMDQTEHIEMVLSPHPMAFFSYYLICIFMIVMGVIFMILDPDYSLANQQGLLALIWQYPLVRIIAWWLILLICGMVASYIFISWIPSVVFIGLALAGSFLGDVPRSVLLVIVGVFGILATESYRRAHRFYVTNCRCVFVREWMLVKNQRHITYEDISDVIHEKGVLGHIFNFGTVMPITPSGIGTGEDTAIAATGASLQRGRVTVGAGVGSARSLTIPRTKSYFCFYKVPEPEKVQALIMSMIHEYQQTPWLRRIAEDIRGLRREITGDRLSSLSEFRLKAMIRTQVSGTAKCAFCHRDISSGFAFRCAVCGAILDQDCANLVKQRGQCPFCKTYLSDL